MRYLIYLLFVMSVQATTAQIALKIKSVDIDVNVQEQDPISGSKVIYKDARIKLNLELTNNTFDIISIDLHPNHLDLLSTLSYNYGDSTWIQKPDLIFADKTYVLINPYKSYCFALCYSLYPSDAFILEKNYIHNIGEILHSLIVQLKVMIPDEANTNLKSFPVWNPEEKYIVITSGQFKPKQVIVENDVEELDNWEYLKTFM